MVTKFADKNLEYVSQTPDAYTVKAESGHLLHVPKAYSKENISHRRQEYRDSWIRVATIGLLLGGIVSVLITPVIIMKNIRLLQNGHLTTEERIHAKHLIIMSLIFLVLGLAFSALLIMHLLY